MSRLLTQEEVDALLSMDESEELGSQEVVLDEGAYDLRAPLLLAGERMVRAQEVFETLAGELARALELMILSERPSEASFAGLVQQPATTVLDTLPADALLGVLEDAAGHVQGGLVLAPELALALVDRLLGGEGVPAAVAARPLTEVESDVLRHSLARAVRHLAEGILPDGTTLGDLEREPQRGALARRRGALCCAHIRVVTPLGESLCRFVATGELMSALLCAGEGPAGAPSQVILDALVGAPMRVDAVLPAGALALSDLVRLRPGHVIELDVDETGLGLRAGGRLVARGELRDEGRKRTLSIMEIEDERGPRPGASREDAE